MDNRRKGQRWSLKKQVVFFETLADMLKNGFSLKQSLINLSILYPVLEEDLNISQKALANGNSFSEALYPYITPNIFNHLLIAENHGQLELSVYQLGKYLRQRLIQKQRLISTMIYPSILGILLIVMIVIFVGWLRPVLLNINSSHCWIPLYCKWIIGILLISIICWGGLKVHWFWHQKIINRYLWLAQLPIIGKGYRYFSYYYLSFNLALLLKSGLNLQEICKYLCQFDKQSLICQLGQHLKGHLERGADVEAFIDKHAFIPPELKAFINKGQTNYELSEDLMIYSQIIYQRLMQLIDRWLNLIQPIAFLIIAVVIVIVYLSILIPIYSNLGGIKG